MSKNRASPRRWQRLSLRTKTVIVTAVPMALIVVAVPLGFMAQRDSVRVERDVEQAYRVRQRLAETQQSLVDAGTGVAGYLLTNDDTLLDTSDAGLAQLPHELRALEALIAGETPSMAQRFARLERLAQTRVDNVLKTRAFGSDTPAGSTPEALIGRGREIMDDIRDLIATMDATEAHRLDAARGRLHDAERLSVTLTAGLVPFAILLAILFALRHTNTLVRGIRRIEENARRLERGEELLDPPPGEDELARLGKALDETATRLVQQEQELRELALVDHLTGLPNRRAFQTLAEHELELAKRTSSVTALLFVDADGLKAVNDRAGHAVGDDMLREVADVLREEVRTADLVARIGGDEFVVMLSRDSALENNDVVERLEAAIGRRNARADRLYALDFSIGVAVFDPADPSTVDELITRADAEMYQVKRAKRLASGHREPSTASATTVWATPASPR